jgi:hypothetical protein
MTTTLLVTTYNAPRQLELSVKSILNQTILPNEIVIADDGSREETFQTIEKLKANSPIPIKHIWQPDEGFRAGAARNNAIKASSCDYIIQIDGDIILEKHFVEDHLKLAKKGTFVCGSRVRLDDKLTKEVLSSGRIELDKGEKGMKSTLNGSRIPFLIPFFKYYKSKNGFYARSCNMACWKSDLLLVNGYNEDISGWGAEDSELSCRLVNAGIKKRFIKFGGVEFHLFHKENDRSFKKQNASITYKTIKDKIKWIPNGIIKNNPGK